MCKGSPQESNIQHYRDPTLTVLVPIQVNSTHDHWSAPSGRAFAPFKLTSISFNESEVWNVLVSLDPTKAKGPDGIGPFILKYCATPLVAPLTQLFNVCMSSSALPSEWKNHNIMMIPIYKSGDRGDVRSYWPISLLCSVSKVLEKLVYQNVIDFITPKISQDQFGFLSGRSCVHKLLTSMSTIVEAINSKSLVDVVYLDLKKAFDLIPHGELLVKLGSFGISGNGFTATSHKDIRCPSK